MATKDGAAKKKGIEQPKKEEFDVAQQKIQQEIDALHADLTALSRKIAAKSTGKEEFLERKSEMRSKLDEYQKIISMCERERAECYDSMKKKNDDDRTARGKLNDFKKTLKFDTIEKIDEELAKIEKRMMTESMSLKEEKKCMQDLKELRANKPQVTKFSVMEKNAASGTDPSVTTKQKIDELKRRIEEARMAKKQQSDQYQKLLDQRHKVMQDVQGEWEERDKINKKIQAKIRARKDIQDEYQRQQREYQTWYAEQKAIKYEKTKVERLQRQADNEKRRAEQVAEHEEEQPHLKETTLLEQTIAYCKTLLPHEEKAAEAKKEETDFNNPEGSAVLIKKNDREEEESMFSAVVQKKQKRTKKKGETKMDTKITHTVESIQIFAEVKVKAPLTIADVPPIVAEMEEQLKGYKEVVTKWESERDERLKKREIAKQEALARAEKKTKEAMEAKEAALARAKEAEAEAAEE